MTIPFKLIFTVLLVSALLQPVSVGSSTPNSLIEHSDFFEKEKSTGMSETDFFEETVAPKNDYSWTINLKLGPYASKDEAQLEADNLKKNDSSSTHSRKKPVFHVSVYAPGSSIVISYLMVRKFVRVRRSIR